MDDYTFSLMRNAFVATLEAGWNYVPSMTVAGELGDESVPNPNPASWTAFKGRLAPVTPDDVPDGAQILTTQLVKLVCDAPSSLFVASGSVRSPAGRRYQVRGAITPETVAPTVGTQVLLVKAS